MTTDPAEIIADALWRLDGIHVTPDGPDEFHHSNAKAMLAKLTTAGWTLLPPGGPEALEAWIVLIPRRLRGYDADWDGRVYSTAEDGREAQQEALDAGYAAILARCIAEPAPTPRRRRDH